MARKKRPHALKGKILTIHRGLAIYQTNASPFWFARIRDSKAKKNIVRSTKETSKIKARQAAQELAADLLSKRTKTPKEFSFQHFADLFLKRAEASVVAGERNANYIRTCRLCLEHKDWGLLKQFAATDIREIKTRDYLHFMAAIRTKCPKLSLSTRNIVRATLRNVLKVARLDGTIESVPETPRTKQKDNPRPFFRFYPLVPKKDDAYQKLIAAAKQMADEGIVIRGNKVTEELYDLILFVVHSFVRPTSTELYAIKNSDVEVASDKPRRLLLTIRNGKTGYRVANTMPACVSVYERMKQRYPDSKPEDYFFLPKMTNRATASRIISRQFNEALKRAGLKRDPFTGMDHTLYSLRHTAICMRIILSKGEVNIFTLAKTAGTSVDQIERFYVKRLPLTADVAKNLQSFGSAAPVKRVSKPRTVIKAPKTPEAETV